MFLKYLDIHGFKSFPDKTRVTFSRGLTAVVGPNGSGKSNLSDAVRWVLGEQSTKTLRGDKMEDVIFSGTKTRKSIGFAEVSLILDNSGRELPIESDEVSITRRFDRSGESEYLINRETVRLKDLHELFMDTGLGRDGYSLVGQGKIAEIISAKNTERRELFEEAAGISKYRYRKAEAQRDLVKAEDNLVRLQDILSELEGRVEPLREQSEKARSFIKLSEEKKRIEVSLWVHTLNHSNQSLKEQSDKLLLCKEQKQMTEEEEDQIENQIQSSYQLVQGCQIEMERLRKEKEQLEGELSEWVSEIAVCKNDIRHHEQNILRITGERNRHADSTQEIEKEIAEKRREIEQQQVSLEAIEQLYQNKQKELTSALLASESSGEQEKELIQKESQLFLFLSQLNMTIETAKQKKNDLVSANDSAKQMAEQRGKETQKYQKDLQETECFLLECEQKTAALKNTAAGYRLKLDNKNVSLYTCKRECEENDLSVKELQQRIKLLEGMEESLEGFSYSVRELMKRTKKQKLSGILGTVSQLIEVQKSYSVAIETAFGGSLQNIVVENEEDAKAAIRILKRENLGRATFLPLTSVNGQLLRTKDIEDEAGYIDLAVNLVEFNEQYRGVMNALLGKIVVAEDIDAAVSIARKFDYSFKIVTLDGQVVNAGGSMTGGSLGKNTGFLSRKNEIAELLERSEEQSGILAKSRLQMSDLQTQISRLEAEYNSILSETITIGEDRIRAQSEKKRLLLLTEQGEQVFAQMELEISSREEKISLLDTDISDNLQNLSASQAELNQIKEKLSLLKEDNQNKEEIRSKLTKEMSALQMDELSLSKDIELARHTISELSARLSGAEIKKEELIAEENSLLLQIGNINRLIEEHTLSIETAKQGIEQCTEQMEKTRTRHNELEASMNQLRSHAKSAQEKKGKFDSEIARLEEREQQLQKDYDNLIMSLWDEYELTRSEAQELADPHVDVQKASSELLSVRNKIRALGNVNVEAIEEFKEVEERYHFLNHQLLDVEKSRSELIKLISDLTEKMQHIFLDNFSKINAAFQRIFPQLFGGGRAELTLSDPKNLLETGIEILVEPPGKIINHLASLSGGEQAFVAVAIYFAMMQVHPAPFCILDEIEAALDDVNVDKYAAYLRAFSEKTQFIAITHRRGTMEAADVLYGVTMQEEGVSKLLQLKVSEIEERLKLGS